MCYCCRNVDQFRELNRIKLWVLVEEASTSTARPNCSFKKVMLFVFWDQKGIEYYELLKTAETVIGEHCRLQIFNLNDAFMDELQNGPAWLTSDVLFHSPYSTRPCPFQ